MRTIVGTIAGLVAMFTLQYFIKAFVTLNFNVLLGPLVTQFWKHAKLYAHPDDHHKAKSPLNCDDCADTLMSMPD